MRKIFKGIVGIIVIFYGVLIFFSKVIDLGKNYQHNSGNKLTISFEEAVKKITLLNNKGKLLDDIEEGLTILQHSDFYLNDAVKLLKKNTLSENEVFVVLELMQYLNDSNYIKLLEVCRELYLKDLLYAYQISYMMNSVTIIKNFYNPRVIKCLLQIKNKSNNQEFDINVNAILSGLSLIYFLGYYFFMDKET